jgi:hypothetical protein
MMSNSQPLRKLVVAVDREFLEGRPPWEAAARFKTKMNNHQLDLGAYMGGVTLIFPGWDADRREVYCIPEIRSFASALHNICPGWLYFGDLDSDTLKVLYGCLLSNVTAIQREVSPMTGMLYEPAELLHLIARDFEPMNTLMEQAGYYEKDMISRTDAIFRYFQLTQL